MREICVDREFAGVKLHKALHKILPQAQTPFLYRMMRKKNITLNDGKCEGNETLSLGDVIKIYFSDETYRKMEGTEESAFSNYPVEEWKKLYDQYGASVSILFEDEDFIFAGKPSGMLSQKDEKSSFSVNEILLGYLLNKNKIPESSLSSFKPSVCNRLDRNTSGLVLFAVSYRGARLLNRLLKERTLKKYYRCIVNQSITAPGHDCAYLVKDKNTNKVTCSHKEMPGSVRIETAYTPVKTGKNQTELEVELITGKSHQIRAHLAFLGMPIAGDPKYGTEERYARGQLLHAYRVEFPDVRCFPEMEDFPQIAGKTFICPKPDTFPEVDA